MPKSLLNEAPPVPVEVKSNNTLQKNNLNQDQN